MSIITEPVPENQMLAAALSYAGRGWLVFPAHSVVDGQCTCGKPSCDRAGKHPRTTHGLKDATTDAEKIRGWWQQWPMANVAIATGPTAGVFMLGPDGQQGIEDLAALQKEHGDLPITPKERSGSGGLHYYFKWPADGAVKNRKNHRNTKIDVRGTGGYSLCAPSANGVGPYVWEIHPDQIEVAPAPQWLLDWVRDDGKKQKPTPAATVGVINSFSSFNSFNSSPPNGKLILTVKPDATPDVQARAIAYLGSCPPAISGQGGHAQTLAVARAIVHGFNLGADAGFNLLQVHYNPKCNPPWTEAELRHKCADADTLPFDKPRGWLLLDTAGAPPAAPDGQQQADTGVDIELMPIPPPPRWPALRDEALHGLAGQIVRTVAPETEAGETAILVQLLAFYGNAVGRGPHFRVGPARHHANLFALVVGDTSSAKGMSLDVAMDVMQRADTTWAGTCVHRGLGSGEGIIETVRDPVTKVESIKDEKGSTIGFKTVVTQEGGKDKRLLAIETEFASVLKKTKRDSSILSETLRSGWDGGVLETLNRKENALRATDAHISVIGHITPCELKHVIVGTPELVNGFSNRFLFLLTRSSQSLPHGGDATVLDRFVEPMKSAITRGRMIGTLQRSQAANRLWEKVYEDLKRSRPGTYGKARERARPQTMRLAMIYALIDGAARIEAEHLQAGLALWEYCDESLQIIFGGSETEDPLIGLVLAKLKNAGTGGMTRTELHHAFSRNIPAAKLLEALARLRDRGDAYPEKVKTGRPGAPVERWFSRRMNELNELNELITPPDLQPTQDAISSFNSFIRSTEKVVRV